MLLPRALTSHHHSPLPNSGVPTRSRMFPLNTRVSAGARTFGPERTQLTGTLGRTRSLLPGFQLSEVGTGSSVAAEISAPKLAGSSDFCSIQPITPD